MSWCTDTPWSTLLQHHSSNALLPNCDAILSQNLSVTVDVTLTWYIFLNNPGLDPGPCMLACASGLRWLASQKAVSHDQQICLQALTYCVWGLLWSGKCVIINMRGTSLILQIWYSLNWTQSQDVHAVLFILHCLHSCTSSTPGAKKPAEHVLFTMKTTEHVILSNEM